jgi:hypothetical protein
MMTRSRGSLPRFVAGFQPTGDLFGRPFLGEPISHETDAKVGVI